MNKLITKISEADPTDPSKVKMSYKCIVPGCGLTRKGAPQESRVLKHASKCSHLPVTLKHEAAEASRDGSLGALLQVADASDVSATQVHGGPAKVRKTQSSLDVAQCREAGKKKVEADRQVFQKKVDHVIMRLICVRGLVPNVIDSSEWKELMATLNPKYHPTSSDTFSDNFIPKEAAFVHHQQLKKLSEHDNLTLTFDGTSTRKPQSLYTVHATTPDWVVYFLDGYEDSLARHTVGWVKDKIFKVCFFLQGSYTDFYVTTHWVYRQSGMSERRNGLEFVLTTPP